LSAGLTEDSVGAVLSNVTADESVVVVTCVPALAGVATSSNSRTNGTVPAVSPDSVASVAVQLYALVFVWTCTLYVSLCLYLYVLVYFCVYFYLFFNVYFYLYVLLNIWF
jgi:hypothetical protein